MNRKEREQAKVFEQVKQEIITKTEGAARLGVSVRWARKKFKRYVRQGDKGLIHQARGRIRPDNWDNQHGKLLIELFEDGNWHGFGPTFTSEKLQQVHGIIVSKDTVRASMITRNLWKPKQQKRKHRARRERRGMVGMMVQLDGSPHDWFEGRADKCTLLVFIDDATSKILWLEFVDGESVVALMKATKNYVQMHGIPQTFYVDHGSVFHVNLNNKEHDKRTQWERAIRQLNSGVIHAHSPQAKGRVERCNRTMQDRLIKEMRLAGVSSMEEANKFVQTSDFIETHNQRFAIKPAQKGDAHKNIQEYDLEDIFSIHAKRVLANDFTIVYNKRIFQLENQQGVTVRPKDEIAVCVRLDGFIRLKIRRTELAYTEIEARSVKEEPREKVVSQIHRKPSRNSQRWAGGLLPLPAENILPRRVG